jgi:phage regulator Rha-like protein
MSAMKSLAPREVASVIEIKRGRPMVSSLKIAELFERRHDSVLRAIRTVLIDKFSLRIHAERDFDQRGKERPVFWLEEVAI